METLQAERWCDDSLKEYDVILKEVEALRDAPKGKEESTLLRSARLRRAETKLATATLKADVASLVLQVMSDVSRGTVTIEVPEVIDVKLTWK